MTQFVPPNSLRADFSRAMSAMYQQEVPAYGTLLKLVKDINHDYLQKHPQLTAQLADGLQRITEERHGAIRLGTAEELAMIRRMFAILGMYPVGYYDLSVADIPVHSTAFRPLELSQLNKNPFRVFTSLLRLELIQDKRLRQQAEATLQQRQIFSPRAIELIQQAESNGGLTAQEGEEFIQQILLTFRWHSHALVGQSFYQQLLEQHRLIADVVCFHGPHINHLTPRTLDIDQVQTTMPDYAIAPKAVIEGPPKRNCPILLRQTSFKAIAEKIKFLQNLQSSEGLLESLSDEVLDDTSQGSHTARFGEIEQRGIALTPKGRKLYDKLLDNVRHRITPKLDGSNSQRYYEILAEEFQQFPDCWTTLHHQQLGYFTYQVADSMPSKPSQKPLVDDGLRQREQLIEQRLIEEGQVTIHPIIYEDFLPVSAAGIFQSNLGDKDNPEIDTTEQQANQQSFEEALGVPVIDPFKQYQKIQDASLSQLSL